MNPSSYLYRLKRPEVLAAVWLLATLPVMGQAYSVRWICTTQAQPWQEMPAPAITPAGADEPALLHVEPEVTYQSIIGFGGCFNELAWSALQAVSPPQRDEAMKALFDKDGCNFTACRMGIGANDFALAWYSLDETPGDYAMAKFNIDEDKKTLIPYIKTALAIQPKLAIWGVPWSPPQWMKTNNSYVGKGGSLKLDPQTQTAYALYFSKYVQAYRAEGIPVRGIFPQNEPTQQRNNYPQCGWTGPEIETFVRDYLVPQLKKDNVQVEVWLGTLNGVDRGISSLLGDPTVNPLLTGLGGQYGGQNLFLTTHGTYPDKLILQTETECDHGTNSWDWAMKTFDHEIDDLNHFANGYMYWNMILNEKATSSWGWRQNSLIILDSQAQKIVYNPEFYALKHFGNLVQPGAVRIKLEGKLARAVAFRNPSGEVVVCFSNDTKAPATIGILVNGSEVKLEVPAQSMDSVVFAK
jgi:glucosylceramidase